MSSHPAHWKLTLAVVLIGIVATSIAAPATTISQTETGETMQAISLLRSDVRDHFDTGINTRFKRYVLQGGRWNSTDLTYRVSKYSRRLNNTFVDKQIKRAFRVWSEHTDLTFTRKETGPVDIEIRFEAWNHGDGKPFDGPYGHMSHVFFPNEGGAVHFDEDEQWTNRKRGVNLFQVAVHQIGHSLGLGSSNKSTVMTEDFDYERNPNFRLNADDIEGIQALYGTKSPSKHKFAKILS